MKKEPIIKNVGNVKKTYTLCFCGSACTRDEGEFFHPNSKEGIYNKNTGYIPVRIHKEISSTLEETEYSSTVRGVGENDWRDSNKKNKELTLDGPINVPKNLLEYTKKYSSGDAYSRYSQVVGKEATALALHGANLAALSGAEQYNFIGHSRGAVECIMAAWFLYAYHDSKVSINIFAIDPVPGIGNWYGILTQLPPNVTNYVGIYAWDQSIQPVDKPYMALVPRPNSQMIGKQDIPKLKKNWKKLADNCQLKDPLKPDTQPQPKQYHLYACRGRHSTVSGNTTFNGGYEPEDARSDVAPISEIVYKMARAYLTEWGTKFKKKSAVEESLTELRRKIHHNYKVFDTMGGGITRTSNKPFRPYVRRVSSIPGRKMYNSYYMDDVVGDPPYKLAYPVTTERENAGWVKWNFL